MSALGLIETKGLLAAVEGADAMLKAADVGLLEKSLASGGLVTITVAGETAAVKAAVDAGSAAIRRLQASALVSAHVIPRPDTELNKVVALKPGFAPAAAPKPASEESAAATPVTPATEKPANPAAKTPEARPQGKKKR